MAAGRIAVTADPSKFPPPPGPEIEDPGDPNFYKQNLADLQSPYPSRRSRALVRLARVEPNELRDEIAAALRNLLASNDPSERRMVTAALGRWGNEDDLIVVALSDLQLGENQAKAAADRLARMQVAQGRRAEVSAALVKLLAGTEDGFAKGSALRALAVWHAPEAIPEMIKCLDHESHGVRWAAFDALGNTQTAEAAQACAERLAGQDRGKVFAALKAMGPAAEDAVLAVLDTPDAKLQAEACRVLGEIGTSKSRSRLMRLTKHNDFFVRTSAQRALRQLGQSRP